MSETQNSRKYLNYEYSIHLHRPISLLIVSLPRVKMFHLARFASCIFSSVICQGCIGLAPWFYYFTGHIYFGPCFALSNIIYSNRGFDTLPLRYKEGVVLIDSICNIMWITYYGNSSCTYWISFSRLGQNQLFLAQRQSGAHNYLIIIFCFIA